jgi:hypothetical protein
VERPGDTAVQGRIGITENDPDRASELFQLGDLLCARFPVPIRPPPIQPVTILVTIRFEIDRPDTRGLGDAFEMAREAECTRLCTVNITISKADELLLETDAVDVVVKATVTRAGQIAAATENSIAEPAPSTAETSAGSSLFRSSAATPGRRRCVALSRLGTN